ncbi:hypothetical protein [Gordonia jinhuaensis]|uniref:hypothetical protein n=1 Tax=Gordonia jinhuaensis TaxID=1517702 RepID=UPI001666BA44|nr:hypothetical protein [Gordonia jinhuaensis]
MGIRLAFSVVVAVTAIGASSCASHSSPSASDVTGSTAARQPTAAVAAPLIDDAADAPGVVVPALAVTPVAVGDAFTVWSAGEVRRPESRVTVLEFDVDPKLGSIVAKAPDGDESDIGRIPLGVRVRVDNVDPAGVAMPASGFGIRERIPDGTPAGGWSVEPVDDRLADTAFADGRRKLTTVDAGTSQEGWLLLDVSAPVGSLVWPTNPGAAVVEY